MFLSDIGKKILLAFVLLIALSLIYVSFGRCQYWTALPPYNTLWPLWSQALSPINPATGLIAPLVNSLEPTTVLPVQPGLTWDPAMPYPWLLYNTPVGMIYYDLMYGLNMWPPANLVNLMTGAPIPLTLPIGFSNLPPTNSTWILNSVPIANDFYTASYPYFSFIGTLPLPTVFNLPPITPTNLVSYLTMLSVPTAVAVPPVLSANAILGF